MSSPTASPDVAAHEPTAPRGPIDHQAIARRKAREARAVTLVAPPARRPPDLPQRGGRRPARRAKGGSRGFGLAGRRLGAVNRSLRDAVRHNRSRPHARGVNCHAADRGRGLLRRPHARRG